MHVKCTEKGHPYLYRKMWRRERERERVTVLEPTNVYTFKFKGQRWPLNAMLATGAL